MTRFKNSKEILENAKAFKYSLHKLRKKKKKGNREGRGGERRTGQ